MESERHPIRRQKVLHVLKGVAVQALLVSNETNVTYLTGFTGDSSYLLIGPDVCLLISDGRYTAQIRQECPSLEVYIRPPSESIVAATVKLIKRTKLRKLGIESDSLSVATAERLVVEIKGLELGSTSGIVEGLREVKDADEIDSIREAIRQAEKGFDVLRAELRGELSELQVAHDLEHTLRQFGARGCSFPPIVAVGHRAALPRARPTSDWVSSGDFVLIDWGAEARAGITVT